MYQPPRPVMDPLIMAFSRSLTQTSRAASFVTRWSGALPIRRKALTDLCIIHDFQEWRLFELHGQRFAQRAVENGLPGVVREIGQYRRPSRRAARPAVVERGA